MSDGVAVTAGLGQTIATDDVSGVHYQLVKPTATSIGDGRKVVTTAGTRVALAPATEVVSVCVTAESDNTGVIVVGGSTVVAALSTRRGTVLYAGDSTTLAIRDLAAVWLDATVSGDGVTYTYLA